MDHSAILLENGYSLSAVQLEQFSHYADQLIAWNEKFNLTAITDKQEIYIRHFLDCLLLTRYPLSGKLCDVGSGAGFPGIVLKIACPELNVTLLEPNNKKVSFLNHMITQLHLEGIQAVSQRAEDYGRSHFQQFDIVTSRAVAALNILDELCLPLVKVGGHFLVCKGPKGPQELEEAAHGIEKLAGQVVSLQEFQLADTATRVIIDITKTKDADRKYPRNYGQIKKKPL